jgi:hypothetical protein
MSRFLLVCSFFLGAFVDLNADPGSLPLQNESAKSFEEILPKQTQGRSQLADSDSLNRDEKVDADVAEANMHQELVQNDPIQNSSNATERIQDLENQMAVLQKRMGEQEPVRIGRHKDGLPMLSFRIGM